MKRVDMAPSGRPTELDEFRILLDRTEDVPERDVGIAVAGATQHFERSRDLPFDVLSHFAVPSERLDAMFGQVNFVGHRILTCFNNRIGG
jgi:hypothetical protein